MLKVTFDYRGSISSFIYLSLYQKCDHFLCWSPLGVKCCGEDGSSIESSIRERQESWRQQLERTACEPVWDVRSAVGSLTPTGTRTILSKIFSALIQNYHTFLNLIISSTNLFVIPTYEFYTVHCKGVRPPNKSFSAQNKSKTLNFCEIFCKGCTEEIGERQCNL